MSQLAKSSLDKRSYKSILLANQLNCLVISDPDTESSAASLSVNVGSLEDPRDREGLAHFCEHMLFMGTTKYPNEAEYNDFISKHSGATNAYTSALNTNFFFQVANDSLAEGLDRFAQFFLDPLFDPSCTNREMNAVDSEFNMNLQNDMWKKYQVMCSLALPNNPQNKFMIGNLKSLQHTDIRDRLIEYHKKYYSSNMMKLVVYGQKPVQELEDMVTQMFVEVKNQDLQPPSYTEVPYTQKSFGNLIKLVPFVDQDTIELVWLLEYMQPHYKNDPLSYISNLIGHEGKNSLLSLLIDEGLASALSCGGENQMRLYSQLAITINLTKKGLSNIQSVLSYTFQYLNMIKQKGTQQWFFEELKAINKMKFEFLEKTEPLSYVADLAMRMHTYPIGELLEAPYFMEFYEEKLIKKCIDSLNADNCIMILSAKQFEGQLDQVEPYFNTQFSVQSIPKEYMDQMLNPSVHPSVSRKVLDLPIQNIFIPKNTDLLPINDEPSILPELVLETSHCRMWFQRDAKFSVPKAVMIIQIHCNDNGQGQSAKANILASLWQLLLKDHLRELSYLAISASLTNDVTISDDGIAIIISGFSESVPLFLIQLIKQIQEFDVQNYQHNFPQAFQQATQNLENFQRYPPYQQVMLLQDIAMIQNTFDPNTLLQTLNKVTWEDLVNFQTKQFKNTRFDWLVMGNVPIQIAKDLVNEVEGIMLPRQLPLNRSLEFRTFKIPSRQTYNYTYTLEEESNSSVILYYQHEASSINSRLVNFITGNIIASPFFQKLRTQEQLGYVVASMVKDIRGVSGFNFLIQSNTKSPQYCQERIKTFINEELFKIIKNMTIEEFEVYKQSVRVSLLEKDNSLNDEAGRQWGEISNNQYVFNKSIGNIQLEELEKISLEQMINYFEEFFIKNPKIMEIHALAKAHTEENTSLRDVHAKSTITSTNLEWIQRRLPLYPDFHSLL